MNQRLRRLAAAPRSHLAVVAWALLTDLGETWCPVAGLAERLGVHERTVQRALADLAAAGVRLSRSRQGVRLSRAERAAGVRLEGDTDATPRVTLTPPPGGTDATPRVALTPPLRAGGGTNHDSTPPPQEGREGEVERELSALGFGDRQIAGLLNGMHRREWAAAWVLWWPAVRHRVSGTADQQRSWLVRRIVRAAAGVVDDQSPPAEWLARGTAQAPGLGGAAKRIRTVAPVAAPAAEVPAECAESWARLLAACGPSSRALLEAAVTVERGAKRDRLRITVPRTVAGFLRGFAALDGHEVVAG